MPKAADAAQYHVQRKLNVVLRRLGIKPTEPVSASRRHVTRLTIERFRMTDDATKDVLDEHLRLLREVSHG